MAVVSPDFLEHLLLVVYWIPLSEIQSSLHAYFLRLDLFFSLD